MLSITLIAILIKILLIILITFIITFVISVIRILFFPKNIEKEKEEWINKNLKKNNEKDK